MARGLKFKAPYCNDECKQIYGNTTNDSDFCLAGYKQNPSTLQGINNLLRNGGIICSRAKTFKAVEEAKAKKKEGRK
jgi:hypothetical protein